MDPRIPPSSPEALSKLAHPSIPNDPADLRQNVEINLFRTSDAAESALDDVKSWEKLKNKEMTPGRHISLLSEKGPVAALAKTATKVGLPLLGNPVTDSKEKPHSKKKKH